MSEQMRKEFEAWANKHNESLRDDRFDQPEDIRLDRQGGVYIWANAESAWLAWQASRAALCVELPVMLYPYPGQDEDGKLTDRDRNVTISHCADAIHAAGVKTK
jgi:hypothetical protein